MKKIKLFRPFIFDESNIRASQSFSYTNWQNGGHYTAIKDDRFYTSDTEAFIVVEHMEDDFQFDTASIVMVNARDDSKVSRTMEVDKENNTVSIELETNQLAHFGPWRAQVLYMYRGETFTSPVLIFEIEQTLGDEQPAKLEDIQSVSGLMNEVNQMLESLRTYGGTIDLTKYALKTDIPTNYLTSVPPEYVTETELQSKNYINLSQVPKESFTKAEADLLYQEKGDYATKSELANAQLDNQEIDLTAYVTETELEAKNYITLAEVPQEQFTRSVADGLYQPKGSYLTRIPNTYQTTSQADGKYQPKGNYLTSIPSEYVTDAELNSALGDIETILASVVGAV